ncbi:MAG: hypothetical protein ABIF82_05845 [Planctomycetota bacterium]
MTTAQYRCIVFGQITAICVSGLVAAFVLLGAWPEFSSRGHLSQAIEHFESGGERGPSQAETALDNALADNSRMIPALALRGLIALQKGEAGRARDAYQNLQQALADAGASEAPALNGIGCTVLLEARTSGTKKQAQLEEAYKQFVDATKLGPENGDAHVNAAICSLHLGHLTRAASHLANARDTQNLAYESLVAYHSALGSLLSRAATDRSTAAAVAARFKDPDPRLEKTGQMLVRSTAEFDKAIALLESDPYLADLWMNVAMARARLLALAPMTKKAAADYRNIISDAVARHEKHFPLDQRQLALVVVALSYSKDGEAALASGVLRQAVRLGKRSGKIDFCIGAAFFHVAQSVSSTSQQLQLEREGGGHHLAALADPALPHPMRFRALSDLGVGQWRAGHHADAIEHMAGAGAILTKLEGTADSPSKSERAIFYRNLAVMRYQDGKVAAAAEAANESLAIDAAQEDLKKLFVQANRAAVITDIQTMTTMKQPPSMPIVTAVIRGGGIAPPTKDEISVAVDGDPVTFTIGPDSQIYALPRKPLAEGKHTVTITVSVPGGAPVRQSTEIIIDYKTFKAGRKEKDES